MTCAAEGLVYVSPKTGRAVSQKGAGEWADRLLPLPPVLRGGSGNDAEIAQGLKVTGHFLTAHLARDLGGKALPEARARFIDALSRRL